MKKTHVQIFILFFATFFVCYCTKKQPLTPLTGQILAPTIEPNSVSVNFCMPSVPPPSNTLKYIFLVDMSGSNYGNPIFDCAGNYLQAGCNNTTAAFNGQYGVTGNPNNPFDAGCSINPFTLSIDPYISNQLDQIRDSLNTNTNPNNFTGTGFDILYQTTAGNPAFPSIPYINPTPFTTPNTCSALLNFDPSNPVTSCFNEAINSDPNFCQYMSISTLTNFQKNVYPCIYFRQLATDPCGYYRFGNIQKTLSQISTSTALQNAYFRFIFFGNSAFYDTCGTTDIDCFFPARMSYIPDANPYKFTQPSICPNNQCLNTEGSASTGITTNTSIACPATPCTAAVNTASCSSKATASTPYFYNASCATTITANFQNQLQKIWAPPRKTPPPSFDPLNTYYPIIDDGQGTNYLDAITKATALIKADAKNLSANENATYIVIMITDGSPYVAVFPTPKEVWWPRQMRQSDADLTFAVSNMVNFQQSNISNIAFYSVYYFAQLNKNNPTQSFANIDRQAQNTLSLMAQTGNGALYTLNNAPFDFSNFQPLNTNNNFSLENIFITNSSISYWQSGTAYADSDHDGIPDVIENTTGNNPVNQDTDGNGVSDLVEMALQGYPDQTQCTLSTPCTATILQKFANIQTSLNLTPQKCPAAGIFVCDNTCKFYNVCGRDFLDSKTKKNQCMLDSNCDGLTNYESFLLSGETSTNILQNIIPDWLALKNFISLSSSKISTLTTPSLDNYSLVDKIKKSLPTSIPVNSLNNITPVTYTTYPFTNANKQLCYTVTANNLPRVKNPGVVKTTASTTSDMIRVDIILKNSNQNPSNLTYTAEKIFDENQTTLTINDWSSTSSDANLWINHP